MTRGFNFNSIPAAKLKRSAFDLSHEFKFTAPLGTLIPVLCQEGLPGDYFKINVAQLSRFMALQSPMMQRVDVKFEFFKVPIRLIYQDWESFLTGGVDGSEAPQAPVMPLHMLKDDSDILDLFGTNSLADYLGLPLPYYMDDVTGTWTKYTTENIDSLSGDISLLPFNAYHKIYNDYYRDQNIIEETELADQSMKYEEDNKTLLVDLLKLHKRAWRKDYFTSALNDPQRGQAVAIGLTGDASVTLNQSIPGVFGNDVNTDPDLVFNFHTNDTIPEDHRVLTVGGVNGSSNLYVDADFEYADDGRINSISGAFKPSGNKHGIADMSDVSAIGITALRTAFKLQQFLERNNIAGARLVETVLAHFGVKSSDARMQRAEFLGRCSFPVNVSPVYSTADTDGAAIGQLGGQAKSAGGSRTISTFCEEHCFIMCMMSYMPVASYSQGLSRMWTRFDKFDYFWPEFQNIGEQNIKNQELYFDFRDDHNNEGDFGYQARYSDYKFNPDRIGGDLRTNLSYWHMGRLFESAPGLNQTFIECSPSDRVFAVKDELSDEHIVADLWFTIKALRPMSRYSTPRIS